MMSVTVLLLVLVRMAAAQSEIKCAGAKLTDAGNMPDPSNGCSSKFYSCPDGATYAIERHCGAASLAFDLQSDKCLSREFTAQCPGGVATEEPTTTEKSDTPTEPPAFLFDCTGRRSGDYNHPNKPCSTLYASCAGGRTFIRECHSGLYFDAVSRQCLEREYVKTCGGSATTPAADEPSTSFKPDEYNCPLDVGSFVMPVPGTLNECYSDYIVCADGVGRKLSCAAGLYYDVISFQCLEKEFVAACGGEVTTTADPADAPTYETPEPVDFDCSSLADGNYESGDCESVYYACVAGVVSPFTCPNNLKFSVTENRCLASTRVESCPDYNPDETDETEGAGAGGAGGSGSSGSGSGSGGSGSGDVPVAPICEGKVDGFYPLSCTDYVFCFAQEPFYQMCPKGKVFHPTINKCVDPSECTAPCGTKDAPPPFDCTQLPVGYYTRGDCSEYFYCEEDLSAWTFECSPGYAFDVNIKECRPKAELPECVPTAPSASRLPWCLRRVNGLHAHPDDCRYAIVCLTGVAFELPCPTAELPRFDPQIGNCAGPTDECQADENQLNNVGVIVIDATYRGLVRR